MNRRTFLKGAFATTVVGATIGYERIHTHALDKTIIPVSIGLNQPLRLVVLGDIHFDPLYEEAYLAYVAREVTDLRADMVLYTGDFITRNALRLKDLAALLSQCRSRLGSFAVFGNHDRWAGGMPVYKALKDQEIRILMNQSYTLPGEDSVYLTGLDSFWAGKPDVNLFARSPVHSRHILLVHEPDSFAHLNDPRIKLQISGHTHGGQVRAPLYGAIVLPKWGRTYEAGLYTQNGRSLYVNRGIGTLFPHVRFNCPPEITLLEVT